MSFWRIYFKNQNIGPRWLYEKLAQNVAQAIFRQNW
jgi:hypothetical protein